MREERINKHVYTLLNDDRFIQWAFHPIPELDNYWQMKMQEDPDLKENTLKLKNLLARVKIKEPNLTVEDKEILWRRIASESIYKKKTVGFRNWMKYAASIIGAVMLLGGGYLVYEKYHKREIDYLSILNKDVRTEDVENIRLILPNKEEIEIPETSVELIHNTVGDIQINMEQVIIAEHSEDVAKEKGQFNQLIVPYGRSSSLVLSDGTKIWVNSGSRLIYPVQFASDKREIFVEGEAYLEVSKNEKIPFFVKTDIWEVKVTGTSFNVCAYTGEFTQSIVLATGSVNVKNLISKEKVNLKPNQVCSYECGNEKVKVAEVDIYDYICWKYGFLRFKSERLDVVLNRLKRFYNIPLEYSDEVKKIRVSGKLDMKENIEDVFRSIAVTAPIQYTHKKDIIKIEVKPLK